MLQRLSRRRTRVPYKNHTPPIPFLDPALDPNHPLNNPPTIPEDPYLPLRKRERLRREQAAVEEALRLYTPPHVLRSWEVDDYRAEWRRDILNLQLSPRPVDLVYRHGKPGADGLDHKRSINQPNFHPAVDDHTDFRRFAEKRLHLGYWRFHHSTDSSEPNETRDPVDTPPDLVCWIMEYTLPECNTIRRQLANAMGIFPAAIDKQTSLYNEDLDYRYGYGRRLLCRCQRWNKRCIRPSHIIVTTFNNILLP